METRAHRLAVAIFRAVLVCIVSLGALAVAFPAQESLCALLSYLSYAHLAETSNSKGAARYNLCCVIGFDRTGDLGKLLLIGMLIPFYATRFYLAISSKEDKYGAFAVFAKHMSVLITCFVLFSLLRLYMA